MDDAPTMSPTSCTSYPREQDRSILRTPLTSTLGSASPPLVKYGYHARGPSDATDVHIASGASSPELMIESDPGLRPIPYLMQRESTSSLPTTARVSESPAATGTGTGTGTDTRRSKKSARDVVSGDMSVAASSSGFRSTTPVSRPSMQRSLSEPDTSPVSMTAVVGGSGSVRFGGQEVDGGVRLAGGRVAPSEVETQPPPYSPYY